MLNNEESLKSVLYRKVHLSGTYDFDHQVIITNQRDKTGPGHWLLTPLKIDNSPNSVFVSRGFIPFSDGESTAWAKYNVIAHESFDAVVQPSVRHRVLLAPGSKTSSLEGTWIEKWLYPDIEHIAKQLSYPVLTTVFLQRLDGPVSGYFPSEALTIEVPSSTHFGYTIEWIILAVGTLTMAFFLQAYPRRRPTNPGSVEP